MEVVAAAGIAMLAYGQIRQGFEQSEILKSQAREMDRQAGLVRRQAEVERQQAGMAMEEAGAEKRKGEILIEQQREKAQKILGEHIARIARGGAAFAGSPLEFLGSEAAEAEHERELIGYESALREWTHKREGAIRLDQAKLLEAEAPMYNVQAQIYRKSAKSAKIGGLLRGFGTAAVGGYGLMSPASAASAGNISWGGYAPGDPTFGGGTPY